MDTTSEDRASVGALDETGTVRVERLVNGGGSGRCALELVGRDGLVVSNGWLEHADDGTHSELDKVKGQEPNDVPHPDDSNPCSRDTLNIREAPVTVSGNDGGDQLGYNEGAK